ncbi:MULTISPECIES: hypothetical protein [Bradyrhizobium]|uniref:hypothetical protein n=1 Tax=Bradyrhizobium TaxID=374 RepID=UPI0010B2F6BF|nr:MULTISPECIES: hypothetical protein [Bradyrhizobium]QOZ22495.1 hypothetical protein XH93_01635 [Bradyrhizobium sp. CCBAU 51753]VIO66804.1 hypothetical protein CI41S_01600 [Bradyrhizobium ivorense]
MNQQQASKINDHLLDALAAMQDAEMAIAGLGKAERLNFDRSLAEVIADFQQKLLEPIYRQYPDLEPPLIDEEPPEVCSELAWDEVKLPSHVTESRLDEIIFSLLTPRWQKVATVLSRGVKRCEALGLPNVDHMMAARLRFLSEADLIEGIGDLRMWGHSEVRLKD